MDKKYPLDHVGVFVSNLDDSKRFYVEVLGLDLIEEDEDEFVWMVSLKSKDQEVHLFKSKDPSTKAHLNHLAFRVSFDQLEALKSDLRNQGVKFSGPFKYKNTEFIKFKDPDGVTWEYTAVSSE
jgi:glyoxylase I family protein